VDDEPVTLLNAQPGAESSLILDGVILNSVVNVDVSLLDVSLLNVSLLNVSLLNVSLLDRVGNGALSPFGSLFDDVDALRAI
jgi:hypothetical protein